MGLRLVAHYYDRNEALIVSAVLDAAGIPNFVHAYEMLSIQPWYEVAFGGYRVMVVEDDLVLAVDVLRESRAHPILEGDVLVTHYHPAFMIAAWITLIFGGFVLFIPYQSHSWRVRAGT
jgi:hypothetical protein